MTEPASASFADLPQELQEMVGSYLNQHDHARCVRVCKHWQSLFTPIFWRELNTRAWSDVKDISRRRKALLQSIKSAGSLKTHGHHLQSLTLKYDKEVFTAFMDHAPAKFPRLASIDTENQHNNNQMAQLLEHIPVGVLKEIVIHKDEDWPIDFRQLSVEALLEHASTLEIVRMEGAPYFRSKEIHRLLCSAPRLKQLYLLSEFREPDDKDGRLNAWDVVIESQEGWVCTKLELFGCEIGGLPRPDITGDQGDDDGSSSLQDSISMQRKVCAQLGRLTSLRMMILRAPTYYQRKSGKFTKSVRLSDCLSMTLESGLDLLKDLKELEVVGCDDMEVYIGKREQAWMRENWPNLKEVVYTNSKGFAGY